MEQLSLNICFSNRHEIVNYELLNYIQTIFNKKNNLSIDPKLYRYVYVMNYLSSRRKINFPDTFPKEYIDEFIKIFNQEIPNITITDYIAMSKDLFSLDMFTIKSDFQEVCNEKKVISKGSREINRKIEVDYILNDFVIPALMLLPKETKDALLEYYKLQPKESIPNIIIHNIPTLNCFVEIMHITSLDDNRKDRINDFYDREIMIEALAYVDVFVSQDKWIHNLLNNEIDLKTISNVDYFNSFECFKDYLLRL